MICRKGGMLQEAALLWWLGGGGLGLGEVCVLGGWGAERFPIRVLPHEGLPTEVGEVRIFSVKKNSEGGGDLRNRTYRGGTGANKGSIHKKVGISDQPCQSLYGSPPGYSPISRGSFSFKS